MIITSTLSCSWLEIILRQGILHAKSDIVRDTPECVPHDCRSVLALTHLPVVTYLLTGTYLLTYLLTYLWNIV